MSKDGQVFWIFPRDFFSYIQKGCFDRSFEVILDDYLGNGNELFSICPNCLAEEVICAIYDWF